MLEEAIAERLENDGGMEKYIHTLEDSDTFYSEAYAIGKVDTLTEISDILKNKRYKKINFTLSFY